MIRGIWELLKQTFSDWSEDRVSRLSASLAFFTLFAMAPLLLLIISIAGLAFEPHEVRGRVVGEIGGLIGEEGARTIEAAVEQADEREAGVLALVISIVMVLVLATGVFVELQDSLNIIFKVKPDPDRALWAVFRTRFLSFGMILGIGFLLMVSLVISMVLAAVSGYFRNLLPGMDWMWMIVHEVVSVGVFTVLFAMIFKVLPDIRIGWKEVFIGAVVTAALFTLGKFLIGLYLGQAAVGEVYGAAGSLVVILLWVYYSAQILFLGAECAAVWIGC
jgi:membrane protein